MGNIVLRSLLQACCAFMLLSCVGENNSLPNSTVISHPAVNHIGVSLPRQILAGEGLTLSEEQWAEITMIACVSVDGGNNSSYFGAHSGGGLWSTSFVVPEGSSVNIDVGFYIDGSQSALVQSRYIPLATYRPLFVQNVDSNFIYDHTSIEYSIDYDSDNDGTIDLWEYNCGTTPSGDFDEVARQCIIASKPESNCDECQITGRFRACP